MSSDYIAIRVQNLSKCYQIYDTPRDRLKQFLFPRFQRLSLQQQKRYFREFWAVNDVSFEVKKGETIGIIGRNGSGKSTLLQMISGTLNPTSGSVQINGRIAALLELGSGFNPEFTGRENIYLNGAILGLTNKEIDDRLAAIMTFADIGDFIDQPVKTYSSGMYVRLAFAIQANVDPDILIVDEALAVGDTYFVHRCMLRFNELQRSGTTILFVSHDANAVRNLCSRAIWLTDGRIMEMGDSSAVVDAYLAHLFGQKVVLPYTATDNKTGESDLQSQTDLQMETSIPNIDRRLGDQSFEVVGVGLYDTSMNRIASSLNDEVVMLRMTIRNNSVSPNVPLVAGYVFRNNRGQEIASSNNKMEGIAIPPIPAGSCHNIRIKISLPRLHPGSYAFSPTAGYIGSDQEIVLSDRIENAVSFDVLSCKEMYTMMAFPTVFEIESGVRSNMRDHNGRSSGYN